VTDKEGSPFKTLETVEEETPARFATSLTVAIDYPHLQKNYKKKQAEFHLLNI
jgi:hypothetical protein